MLKEFFSTPFIAGMEDGVNPCYLITFAVFLLGLLWLRKMGISRWWAVLFIGLMMIDTFAFNCGLFDKLVISNYFQLIARVIYLVVAIYVGMAGIKFLREWFLLFKGKKAAPVEEPVKKKTSAVVLLALLFVAGFLLSMLSTLWPANAHVMTFSVYMMLPGKFVALGTLVFIYSIVCFWFVLTAIPVYLLEAKNPRLFKIAAAASLLAASLSVIDIIFMKG